jgi:glycosyltransferase involved in cell wall biosynthesis
VTLHRDAEQRLIGSCDVLVVHGVRELARARSLRGPARRVVHIPPGVDVDTFCRLPLRAEGKPALLVLDKPHSGYGEISGIPMRWIDQPWGPERWRPENPRGLCISLNASAACLALPPPAWEAWFDSTPFGILEAAACHRPVVAPRLPGVVEILGEAGEHLLFDPSVPADVVRIAGSVIAQPQAYEPLLEAIGARVRSCFSASAMRGRLQSLYAGLVPARGDPPVLPVPSAD